jgi:regulator of sigma D
MRKRKEIAQKADRAASAIGDAMVKTLADVRPAIADQYELDDQLLTLAIAKAAMVITADAASQVSGMETEECNELEDRLHEVVLDAMHKVTKR